MPQTCAAAHLRFFLLAGAGFPFGLLGFALLLGFGAGLGATGLPFIFAAGTAAAGTGAATAGFFSIFPFAFAVSLTSAFLGSAFPRPRLAGGGGGGSGGA